MMPIFFHLQSHLWIAYLLVINGLGLHLILRSYVASYRQLSTPFEAQAMASLFLSIGLNAGVILYCQWQQLAFAESLPFYLGLSVLLSVWLVWLIKSGRIQVAVQPLTISVNQLLRAALYLCVFVLLFLNGGLIEQITDAWWHLSLAQKIAHTGVIEQSVGHLNGLSDRYYPPLWHGNLALLAQLSQQDLPLLWNSLTAWLAMFKVMSFYLLALGLSKDRRVALISALLFVLLPGIGDSYLRVSAWPSHLAYTALFAAMYTAFRLLDECQQQAASPLQVLSTTVLRRKSYLICLIGMALIIYYSHKVELVWFAMAFVAYLASLVIRNGLVPHAKRLETSLVLVLARAGLLALSFGAVLLLFSELGGFSELGLSLGRLELDQLLAHLLVIAVLSLLVLCSFLPVRNSKWLLLLVCGAMIDLALSINYTHLASLFNHQLALPRSSLHELPLVAKGWFGGELIVPGWHLQLRAGLLYSGIVAIPLALLLAVFRPSRLSLFCAANALMVLLFCSSPYLYYWLTHAMNYHSSWRVAILLFHPIVFAAVLLELWRLCHAQVGLKKVAGVILMVCVLGLIAFDAKPHFSAELIQAKRNNQSPQRNWNVFYDQRYVWADSSLRYASDMAQIAQQVEPESVIFSDRATSYYLAAQLPVYVRNVQRHQGASDYGAWYRIIRAKHFCYLDQAASKQQVRRFLQTLASGADVARQQRLDYIVINKDPSNRTIRYSCMWNRRQAILDNIEDFAQLEFSGEYLNLYSFSKLPRD